MLAIALKYPRFSVTLMVLMTVLTIGSGVGVAADAPGGAAVTFFGAVDGKPLNLGGGIAISGAVNPYVSFEGLALASFWSSRSFARFTAGPVFRIPLVQNGDSGLRLTLAAEPGYFYRREGGFNFHNFILSGGPGLELQLQRNLGIDGRFFTNVTNDNSETVFYTGLLGLRCQF